MSNYYQPDDAAYPDGINAIKLLSQRDVALHIPVNFVPVTGVSISTCFLSQRYDLTATKCFSNLLAAGFRRFDLDLWWDESRYLWTLCPVQLALSRSSTSSFAATSTSNSTISARAAIENAQNAVNQRQALTTSPGSLTQTSATLQPPSSTITMLSSSSPTAQVSSGDLVQIGSYTCAPELDFNIMLSVLISHLEATESNLNATTNYITLNLHAARSDPNQPPSVPSRLPGNDRALASLIAANASDYLYTPANLQQQRANLNATGSWYNVPQAVLPDSSYFQVTAQDSTPNGWPTESFIEFTRFKRLLVSFGNVSAEMSGYNLSSDAATIFQPGYITRTPGFSLSTDGTVQNGCFYNPSSLDLSAVNNSWAVAYTRDVSAQTLLYQAGNLTDCGFTAMLNTSLGNTTAAQDPARYGDYAISSIWSWADPEPRDNSDHCAVLNATSGRWQVEGCSASHHCACDTGTPYGWQISNQRLSYDRTDQSCPQGTTFGISRTALENSYLVDAWKNSRASQSISDELLWINLNDLSVPGCWVEGQNTTCPYQPQDLTQSRVYIVPTVAGVIILVLTILTIIIKCGSNRRASKTRRRRGGEIVEYEGIPS